MITSIKDLTKELEKLSYSIEQVLKQSSYSEYDDLSGLECDLTDPNELMLREEYRSILDHLDQANYTINYLSRPIKTEGYLHKQNNGRYSVNDTELSSGCGLEVLIYDDFEERYSWVASRIEHNGQDYYIVGLRDTKLEGLKARIRERS